MSQSSTSLFQNQFGDIITQKRTQYVQKNETKQIINGIVELTEVPDSFTKVTVTGNNMQWYETTDAPSGNLYQPDYSGNLVYFDPIYNNVSLNFSYMGTGNKLISSNQVYTAMDSNGNVTQTLSDLTTNAANATTQAQQATTDANNATSQLTTLESTVNTNEQTRQTNEQSRVTAEQNRVTSESNRASSETTRQNNETTRQTDETNRESAETSRVNSENGRVSAEQGRVNAETTRESNESTRQTNETNRVNAEDNRTSAESTRVSQESTRQTDETNRQSAETARANNETTRQSQEQSRQSAETSRSNAELSRVSAEQSRVDAENQRVSQESTRETNEQTRESNETTRESNESARESNETARQNAINNLAAQTASWNNTTAYKTRNIVRYTGASYIALQDNTGFEPDQNLGTYWQLVAQDGSISNVSSANSDISVANGNVAPVLTVNSGNGANQLWKLDGNANAILYGDLGIGTSAPNYALHMYDGGLRMQMLPDPTTAPTITPIGTTGTTGYSYAIVPKNRFGNRTNVTPAGSTFSGNATLSGTNYNQITWTAVSGAVSYDVLLEAPGAIYYLLGNTTNTTFNDTIGSGTAYTIPTYNETAEFISDGNINLMPQIPAKSGVGQSHKPSSRLNFVWSSYSSGTVTNKTSYMNVDGDNFNWYNSAGQLVMSLNANGLYDIKSFTTASGNYIDDGNKNAEVRGDFSFYNVSTANVSNSSNRFSFGSYDSPSNTTWYNYLQTDHNGTLGFYQANSSAWNNKTGTLVFTLDGSGNMNANGTISSNGVPVQLNQMVTTLPTASASYRGQTIVLQGASGVADVLYVCKKLADDTYSWVQIG